MSGRHGVALLLTSLTALSVGGPASATTASVLGVGPNTRALAGAGATQAVGYESAFENPAGLAQNPQLSLSAGYGIAIPWLYTQRPGQPEQRFDTEPLGVAELGFTLPLWTFGQRFVLGFASTSPGGLVARADLPLPDEPQFPVLLSRQQAVDFDLALGVRPFHFLALGVGLRAQASLSGTAKVEQGKQGTIARVNDGLEPVLSPTAGVTAFFTESAKLALVVRAPLRANFDILLSAVDLGATQLPPLHLAGVAHYDPLALQVEYAERVGPLEALFGAVYQRFRSTPALLADTVSCPPQRPGCAALSARSPGFHDTVDLHLAATLSLPLARFATARLRAGYAFVPSPVPEQTGPENLLDNSRHRLGLGYGLSLTKPLPPLGLDAALTIDELIARSSRKRADVPIDNLGGPTLTSRGALLGLSLALTVKL